MFTFIYNTITRSVLVLLVAMLSVNFLPDHMFHDFKFEPRTREPVDFDAVIPVWNTKLSDNAEFIQLNNILGPESIAFSNEGLLYTGLADGRIVELDPKNDYKLRNVLRFNPNCPDNVATRADECGRFLQLRFVNNTLYAIEANTGLYKVDVKTGSKNYLGPRLNFKTKLFNSFVFDQKIPDLVYITVTSTRWSLLNIMWSIQELEASSKLLAMDVSTGKYVTIFKDMLSLNGIEYDAGRDRLVLAETMKGQVTTTRLPEIRQAFSKASSGDDLRSLSRRTLGPIQPGNPDNLVIDGDKLYIALPFVKNRGKDIVDYLSNMPKLRMAYSRVIFGTGKILEYICVNLYNHPLLESAYRKFKSGHLLYSIMRSHQSGVVEYNLATGYSRLLGSEMFGFVSEAVPHEGYLYLGSFRSPFIVKVKVT